MVKANISGSLYAVDTQDGTAKNNYDRSLDNMEQGALYFEYHFIAAIVISSHRPLTSPEALK